MADLNLQTLRTWRQQLSPYIPSIEAELSEQEGLSISRKAVGVTRTEEKKLGFEVVLFLNIPY